jgi:hypothetical protein
MLTPAIGGISVGHHNGRKIEVLPGSQVYAFAGDQGQAHRFRILAELNHVLPTQRSHPMDYPLALSSGLVSQFASTGIQTSSIGVNTLLAFSHSGIRQCCVFEGPMQPRLLDRDHYYVALGTGKLSADPFLRFLVDIFCTGPPTVREAIFLTTWTIQHVIDTNPGGVAGPIRIAVLESSNNQWQARELPVDEIAEHQQAVESAASALRTWRDELQSGKAAEGIGLQPGDEFVHISCWHVLPRKKNERARGEQRDRHKIIQNIVSNRVESAVEHVRGQASKCNRIAVRSCASSSAYAYASIGSADIFNDDGLSERSPHAFGHHSRDYIGGAARSEPHDQANGPRRIGLRHCDPRCGRDRGSARRQMQKSTTRKFCCFHPEQPALQQGGLDRTPPRWPGFRYRRQGLSSALATLANNGHKSLLRALLVAAGKAMTSRFARVHCALMPASLKIGHHFSISAF